MLKLRDIFTLYLLLSFVVILLFGIWVHESVQKKSVQNALEISLRALAEKQHKDAGGHIEQDYLGRLSQHNHWTSLPESIRDGLEPKALYDNNIYFGEFLNNKISAVLPYRNSQGKIIYYAIKADCSTIPLAFYDIHISVVLYILMILLILVCVAYLLAKKVMRPLNLLAEFTKQNESGTLSIPASLAKRKDEIGDVARALNLSLHNIRDQQIREKQFLQNASHELRSPLATIGSALHVINLRQTKGKGFEDSLLQIKHCYQQMTQLTQALLWLSKEEKSFQTTEFNLSELIELHLHQLDHLITNKAVEVIFIQENILIKQARALVDVVISNLIRNAFENSTGGKIILHHSASGVSISNPIYRAKQAGIETDQNTAHQGFGLGLHLVNKVAEKQNWDLKIHESEQQMDVQVCW